MDTDTKVLEEIGLTKTEAKIYLALLRLGQTTTTHIVRESGIHASKVYEFLDRLIKKGLVSYTIQSNRKHFSATEPEFLRELLIEKKNVIEEQRKEVEKLIPALRMMKKSRESRIKSEIYEGQKGLKSVYEKILSTLGEGETQYVIGAPRIGNELIEGFLMGWHKRRAKKGIKCRYIYDSNVRDYGKVRERMPLTEVRYLPNNVISPVWIEIFGDCVVIGHIKGYNAVVFLIEDEEIAKGYLDYFRLLWEASEK